MKRLFPIIVIICLLLVSCTKPSSHTKNASENTKKPVISSTSENGQKHENTKIETAANKTVANKTTTNKTDTNKPAVVSKPVQNSTAEKTQQQPKQNNNSLLNILSPVGPYVEEYNVVATWNKVPQSTGYTFVAFDLTDNVQLISGDTYGTSFQIGNDVEFIKDHHAGNSTYLKEGHKVRLTVWCTRPWNNGEIKSLDKIVTVDSLKAKPITMIFPKKGAVLSAASTKDFMTFTFTGPDRPLIYDISIWDNTDKKWVADTSGIEKIIYINKNTLMPGHKYTLNICAHWRGDEYLEVATISQGFQCDFSVAAK